jgi:hypothetical protein
VTRPPTPLYVPSRMDPRKRDAREAWERNLAQKELDERLELHRRLALTGDVVLRESA